MTQSTTALDATKPAKGGRAPAGTDPRKRRQILEGASRVFSNLGFDAASMSDVAREAAVSKATLYVYFQDKEHLFSAICAEKRDRNIAELITLLDRNKPLEETLMTFGVDLVQRISQPHVVAANRIVIGVAERMPEIGQDFFQGGAMRLAKAVADFIVFHAERGELRVSDAHHAASQFLELSLVGIFRPRLYGVITEPASDEEGQIVVKSAVRVFLAAYGAKQG